MPTLIERPTIVEAAGNKPKQIQEFAGRVNTGHQGVSIARMVSPAGWREPGQRPAVRGNHCRAPRDGACRARRRGHRRARRAGGRRIAWRVDPLQQPGSRWSRVHRRVHAGIFTRHSSSRSRMTQALPRHPCRNSGNMSRSGGDMSFRHVASVVASVALLSSGVQAQWLNYPTPGTPRTLRRQAGSRSPCSADT